LPPLHFPTLEPSELIPLLSLSLSLPHHRICAGVLGVWTHSVEELYCVCNPDLGVWTHSVELYCVSNPDLGVWTHSVEELYCVSNPDLGVWTHSVELYCVSNPDLGVWTHSVEERYCVSNPDLGVWTHSVEELYCVSNPDLGVRTDAQCRGRVTVLLRLCAVLPTASSDEMTLTSPSMETSSAELLGGGDSPLSKRVTETLLASLSETERRAILNVPAAQNPEDLRMFAKLLHYFQGRHHLEVIMYSENMRRSALLMLIDKFRSVLVVRNHEDPIISVFQSPFV
uniref:GATOR1 complex protein NPRL3 C-terminal HTH domain-containing protein n=1 Tax=Callorhinchus milii TaxID=7868 RepID=A0A4W3GQW7_CALMI